MGVLEEIAPVAGRSAVAAEDANFCNHWGFDMTAIREAIRRAATAAPAPSASRS